MSGLGLLANHHWFICVDYATPTTRQRNYFVCLSAMAPLPTLVWVLCLFVPHGMHLVVPIYPYFFWVVCHPSRTFPPKKPEQEPQNRFFPSPHCQTMPSYLWPMTSPHPILVRYRLVMPRPCACFTSMYVQSLLAAHTHAVIWRLICTFCQSFLASYGLGYFLISYFMCPCFLWGWALLDYGLPFL